MPHAHCGTHFPQINKLNIIKLKANILKNRTPTFLVDIKSIVLNVTRTLLNILQNVFVPYKACNDYLMFNESISK